MSKSGQVTVASTPASSWTDGRIFGLEDTIDDARILDQPLSHWRSGWRRAEPGETVAGPGLLVGRDLWLSDDLGVALEQASQGQLVRLGRKMDGPGPFADPLGRLERRDERVVFDVWWLPSGTSVRAPGPDGLSSELAEAPLVEVETRTHDVSIAVDPELTGADELALSVGAVTAAPVGHWAEIVRANLLAIGTRILNQGVGTAILRVLWAIIRKLSVDPFVVLAAVTRRGRGCRIHPTAVVEGCILGDRVQVDAGAVLRGCIVGDGAQIGAQAIAEFTVVGRGARLYRRAMANLTVIYPEARVGGIVQLAFVGQSACTKMFAVGTDMRLGGPVRVTSPDGLRPVDIGYHGVCFGHGSFVGSGVWIAPGRIIEAGRQVVRPREDIIV